MQVTSKINYQVQEEVQDQVEDAGVKNKSSQHTNKWNHTEICSTI